MCIRDRLGDRLRRKSHLFTLLVVFLHVLLDHLIQVDLVDLFVYDDLLNHTHNGAGYPVDTKTGGQGETEYNGCLLYTSEISAGETPEILDACPMEVGSYSFNFCLASSLKL